MRDREKDLPAFLLLHSKLINASYTQTLLAINTSEWVKTNVNSTCLPFKTTHNT